MVDYENYKNNLDVIDRDDLEYLDVNKKVIYNGPLKNIAKNSNEPRKNFQPLAAAVIGLNNTALAHHGISDNVNIWTDHDTQEYYLNSKPTCYLIVGKPGSGSYTLGEAMSKKYNCIHLCPRNILADEIDQNSMTGKCVTFNMKHNKEIKCNTILSMMKSKLESAVIKHRGYVLTGLPLVTSDISLQYLSNTLYSEEALDVVDEILFDIIVNLKKKKPKKPKVGSHTSMSSDAGEPGAEEEIEEEQEEEHVEEETEEQSAELPKFLLDFCANIIMPEKPQLVTQKIILLKQLQEIFDLALHPDIIIYLTCSDKDLVTKKNHKYYNFRNNIYTFHQLNVNPESELRWPVKYTLTEYMSPYDSHKFNPKYNCRHPINFESNSINQMCNYKQHVLPFIENKLKEFDPNKIIKLDAYASVHEMMHQLTGRLTFLSVKPVIIPEPLFIEDPPEEMEDFWNLVGELHAIKNGVLTFYCYPSIWYNRCPVELQKRRSTRGLPKFAISLFKHVFVMSSLNSFISFYKNPRPYLKMKFLEPTCRIIVTGTKSTGKTMISKCLSFVFDAPIISYEKFMEDERQKKYIMYSKTILSEIIPVIEDARLLDWKNTESERLNKLNKWTENTFKILKEYIPTLIEILDYNKRELDSEVKQDETDDAKIKLMENYDRLRRAISFLPFIDDAEKCLRVLQDKSLMQFAPLDLITFTNKPDIPALGDEDVTKAIENYIITNELQKDLEPTSEEIMTELTKILLRIDDESKQKEDCYGKYIVDGFPSNPELWDYLNEMNLLPDNTISIMESREIEADLIQNYKRVENGLKNYQERFILADDPLIVTKLRTTTLPNTNDVDIQIIINDFITAFLNTNIVNEDIIVEKDTNVEANYITNFIASIEKFREDWDSVKLKLEDGYKSFIEVDLDSKTDIEIVEEVLLKLRKSYFLTSEVNEDDISEPMDEDDQPKDMISYNDSRNLCDTATYCPITFYNYGVLWEGKPEFSVKYNNKIHYFSKEECLELFQNDVTRYQAYNQPFKHLPPLRLCVVGCIGSGKSSVSKVIAKELGLIHINFSDIINDYLIPKHFKKVGRQYENIFIDVPIDEEGVMEFQLDEENDNLVSDILANETEIRRMVYNYFERGAPILPVLMQRLLKKLWFEIPFSESGFVLDGYPRLPTDVEDMIACYCIPDLIIELECNSETSLQRLSPKMFKIWKSQLNEAKHIAKKKLDGETQKWLEFITKNVVVKLILDDILNYVIPSSGEEANLMSTGSAIIEPNPQGSLNVENNLFVIYNDMIQEYPAPVNQNEWEKSDEAHERIDARIEGIFEVEDEGLQSLKDILLEQNIKLFSVNGTKPINKVLRLILFKLSNLRNRNQSIFEQTFIISYDIAEFLLSKGFYFFSKFERMCPVYIYENPQTILNPFNIMKRKGELFSVIHRSYIYFISSEDNLKKFRTDPLKYVTGDAIHSFKEYPITIGIIGAPKSGKSVLAQKLAKRYGLKCISRGKALRYVLENLHWTELSSCIKTALNEGDCVKYGHIVKAVQIIAIDYRTTIYGFVFDGFPESAAEAMELVNAGLYPNFIIDISNNTKNVLRNSQNEVYFEIIKRNPPYSAPLIEYRYSEWSKRSHNIRNWIKNDIQNLHSIDGGKSKWQCFQDTIDHIDKIVPKIHAYLINVKDNIVPAHFMCISDEIFRNRMSGFKDMCPVCFRLKILRHSGHPVDKKGVVQFKNKFYWICAEHINLVLKYPGYLSTDKIEIPEIPAIVQTVNLDLVYENGICIVTYAQNLPSQKFVRGINKYAASFRGKTYLFCSSKCLDTFIAKPHNFYDIVVFSHKKIFPELSLKKLPNIGYLEQTLGNIITEACCAVNVMRPKYPGLDSKVSALLYIALYLKTHNPLNDESALSVYEKIAKIYDIRCRLIIDIGLRLRSMDNPFAKYPKCCHKIECIDSGTVMKSSSYTTDATSLSEAVV